MKKSAPARPAHARRHDVIVMPVGMQEVEILRQLAFLLIVALIAAYIPAEAQNSWVAIVSPTDGESLSGRRAEVSISFNTDSSDKVTRIEIDIDGTRSGLKYLAEPTARGVASFLIDTITLGNGSHNIVAKVYSGDRLVGSTSGSCRIGNVPVDVTPPDVSFTDIKDGETLTGVAEIEVVAEDASGDDCLVSVFIDSSLKLIKNTPPYTYAWDTTSYENGRHKLEATAFDTAGNKAEAESVDIIVENSAPNTLPAGPVTERAKPLSVEKPAEERPVPTEALPQIPVERQRRDSAARSVERSNTASSTTSTAPAKPRETQIIAALPADVAAPTASDKPTADPPVATPMTGVSSEDAPKIKSITIRPASAPKLLRPDAPQPKPARMARAPKPELPKIQPVVEPKRMLRKLQIKKHNGGSFVELRQAIEAAGGTIISWDQKTKTVIAAVGGQIVKIRIDQMTATVAGQPHKLSSAPFVNSQGRTMVDVNFMKSLVGDKIQIDDRVAQSLALPI